MFVYLVAENGCLWAKGLCVFQKVGGMFLPAFYIGREMVPRTASGGRLLIGVKGFHKMKGIHGGW